MNLATGILATWRLASLLYAEDGPADVFAKMRDMAGVRYDERSNRVADTIAGKALCCFWCTSMWSALVVSGGSLVRALAYSAGAILIREFTGRPE